MNYFQNVSCLSELKSQYRNLVLVNHPDKGGDTQTMQAINDAFAGLFQEFKDNKRTNNSTSNGYENDFNDARTASEYTEYVYSEYGWTGSNYFTHNRGKIVVILREWLKKTYPQFSFTVNKNGYSSINIHVMTMDFCPWKDGNVRVGYKPERGTDEKLTERAQDVLNNIRNYMNSYNYDNSDIMTDYFDINFFDSIEFGNNRTPFKVETVRSRRMSGEMPTEFKWKDGVAHKAIKKALGSLAFGLCDWGYNEGKIALGKYLVDRYCDSETGFQFYTNDYSQPSIIKKKIQKFAEVGIICKESYNNILFVGYSEEVEQNLAAEDRAKEEAFKEWQEEQSCLQKQGKQ